MSGVKTEVNFAPTEIFVATFGVEEAQKEAAEFDKATWGTSAKRPTFVLPPKMKEEVQVESGRPCTACVVAGVLIISVTAVGFWYFFYRYGKLI